VKKVAMGLGDQGTMTSDPMRKASFFGGILTRRHCPVKEGLSKRYRTIAEGTADIIPLFMKDGTLSAHNGTFLRLIDHPDVRELI
jgi:hypothetical protein